MSEKKREDSWIDEHDLVLAETVLDHIRNGSTQLAAFEEASSKIKRTASACGFRWNKEIRKKYENELHEAKQNRVKQRPAQQERKQELIVTISNVPATAEKTNDSDATVSNNDALQQIIKLVTDQFQKYDELLQENIALNKEINELKSQKQYEDPEILAKEDLDAFLQIMKRAKSLTHVNTHA